MNDVFTTAQYFYGEQERWSYGFETPNKGAVLWVCLVPLLWALWWAAWGERQKWRLAFRGVAICGATGLFLAGCYFLFMTYSRGGMVAALTGIAYVSARELWERRTAGWARPLAALGVLAIACGVFFYVGLGERTLETGGDASAGNRLVLWKGGLQMAADVPLGFGAGNSGRMFMEWYQPLDRDEGYRTMVNSYLTLLVERGYPAFFLTIALALFFWFWTYPDSREGRAPAGWIKDAFFGLRGLLLAFAVSGFFSTVMEEPKLWILPGIAAALLAILSLRNRPKVWQPISLAAAACAVLWIGGIAIGRGDVLERRFSTREGKAELLALKPTEGAALVLDLVPDETVMGADQGKAIRRMALGVPCEIQLDSRGSESRSQALLVAGEGIGRVDAASVSKLVLLAPAITEEETAKTLLTRNKPLLLLLPEIDEDGRMDFWRGLAEELAVVQGDEQNTDVSGEPKTPGSVQIHLLAGVGNDVTWAWDEVIQTLQPRR